MQQQKYFQNILDCIQDRIYVTDPTGKIMLINQAVERDCDEKHKKDDLIGKNMRDLVKEGFMKESLTLKILEDGKAQGCIYHEPEGYDLLGWGMPLIWKTTL